MRATAVAGAALAVPVMPPAGGISPFLPLETAIKTIAAAMSSTPVAPAIISRRVLEESVPFFSDPGAPMGAAVSSAGWGCASRVSSAAAVVEPKEKPHLGQKRCSGCTGFPHRAQ
jgi:hypothetical protein